MSNRTYLLVIDIQVAKLLKLGGELLAEIADILQGQNECSAPQRKTKKTHKAKAQVSGYTLFQKAKSKELKSDNPSHPYSGLVLSDYSKLVSSSWNALNDSEQSEWREKATELNKNNPQGPTSDKKKARKPSKTSPDTPRKKVKIESEH